MNYSKLFITESLCSFFVGGILVFLIVLISSFLSFHITTQAQYIYTSVAEEITKYTIILLLLFVFRFQIFSLVFVGMGFGFAEAVNRIYSHHILSLLPFVSHIIFGVVMILIIYFSQQTKGRNRILYSLALILPSFLHTFYNLYLLNGGF
jgi:hypothetical protein